MRLGCSSGPVWTERIWKETDLFFFLIGAIPMCSTEYSRVRYVKNTAVIYCLIYKLGY
jgi:hypothetical protein